MSISPQRFHSTLEINIIYLLDKATDRNLFYPIIMTEMLLDFAGHKEFFSSRENNLRKATPLDLSV